MPKTRVDDRMKDYNRLINRDKDRVEEGPYKNFLDKLSVLVKLTEELYKPADDGHAKQMTPEHYKELMSAYKGVQKACREYMKDDEKTKLEQSRERIVKRIQNYMTKDVSLLNGLDINHLPSLPDAIKKARTVQIDLTGKKLDMLSGAQNIRIAVKSAKGTKGFFTEKSGFDKQKEWENILDRLSADVPEHYKKVFESVRNDKEKRDKIITESKRKEMFEKTDMENHLNDLYDIMTGKQGRGFGNLVIMSEEELADAGKMQEVLKKLSISSSMIKAKELYVKLAGIQSMERLDQRNSAMTTIAELLGSPKVLARSVPMTVVRNGKVVEGTFMEMAEGVTSQNLGPEDMDLANCTEESIGTPQALKQLAEIQVLDYLCGNIDRHVGNMFYQFEKGKDGKPYLSKITGIDNDSSFGIKKLETDKETVFFGGLKNMKVISARQYQAVRNLNQDILKEVLLPYEFTDQEIESVWKRVDYLKQEVRKKNIKVMKDKDWEQMKLKDLSQGKNIFYHAKGLPKLFSKRLEKAMENNIERKREIEFAKTDQVKGQLYRADLDKNHEKLMKLVDGIRAADDNLYINSSSFRKMRNTAYELGNFSKEMMSRYPKKDMRISEEDQMKLNELYEKMEQTSQAYIDAKKLSPKTDHGKLRLDLAKDLRDLSTDSLDLLEPDDLKLDTQEHPSPELNEPRKEELLIDEGPELH